MTARLLVIVAALQMFYPSSTRAQEALQVTQCSRQEVDDWNFVQREMEGARAIDIDNSLIGPYVAKRFLLFDNWHPLLETKQVSCGKLRHFKVYNFLFGEHDWNLYLEPVGAFQNAFQDALTYTSDKNQVWNCDIPDNPRSSNDHSAPNCFEAEVTPLEEFRSDNPWFHPDNSNTLGIDKKVCAMGPWVEEDVHGGRPELHPVEAIWWKDKTAPLWTFIEVQDSSHRFEDRSDFVDTPADWTPWAASPRQQDLRVAAKLDVHSSGISEYTVTQVPKCYGNLAPGENPNRATTHFYTYNSKPILKIAEDRADVAFSVKPSFCSLPDGTQDLIGYIQIRAGIGNGSKEGYQAVTIEEGKPSSTAVSCSNNPSYVLKPELDSLRIRSDSHGDVLELDAVVQPSLPEQNLPGNLSIRMRQDGNETLQSLAPAGPKDEVGSEMIVQNIELTKGQSVAIADSPKTEASLTVEPIITRNKASAEDLEASRSATVSFVRAAGGTTAPRNIQAVKVRRLSLTSEARYVPTRDGEAEPEEESAVAETINRSLDVGDLRMFAPLHKPPMNIVWDYTGLDCGSSDHVDCEHGAPQQVQHMKPPSDEERVHPKWIYADVSYPADPTKTSIEIFFPTIDKKRVYEVIITATATDKLSGNKDTYKFEYWNAEQPIPGSGEKAVQWVMLYAVGAAGASTDLLDECKTGPTTDLLVDLKTDLHRRCTMLRLFAASVAHKGTMEVPDLRKMIKAVSNLKGTQISANLRAPNRK